MKEAILAVLSTILLVVVTVALSWALVLLVSWLITLCFGLEWSLLIGTGVWLCCILLRVTIGAADDKKTFS